MDPDVMRIRLLPNFLWKCMSAHIETSLFAMSKTACELLGRPNLHVVDSPCREWPCEASFHKPCSSEHANTAARLLHMRCLGQ